MNSVASKILRCLKQAFPLNRSGLTLLGISPVIFQAVSDPENPLSASRRKWVILILVTLLLGLLAGSIVKAWGKGNAPKRTAWIPAGALVCAGVCWVLGILSGTAVVVWTVFGLSLLGFELWSAWCAIAPDAKSK